jgi:N-acylneuraminate cytidylyltransferase
MDPICIIPARGGSKRLPRKNLALLDGKPLLAYAVEAARESGIFDRICVSSDDEEILETAREYGAEARDRPEALATDRSQVKDVCAHLLEQLAEEGNPYEKFGLLLVTSPLRTGSDVREAYRTFQEEEGSFLMSLVPFSHPPQRAVHMSDDGFVEPFFGQEYMTQAQELETLYRHDGAIVFAEVGPFLKEGKLYGSSVIPYVMPEERAVDIDTEEDLRRAEFLKNQSESRNE